MQLRGIVGVYGAFLVLCGYGCVEAGDGKPAPSINQNRPVNSPNVVGNNNSVVINPDQARRIKKEDEFVRALRAVGPVTIGLESYDDRDALFLYGQLYKLFTVSKWAAPERGTVTGSPWVGVHVVVKDKDNVPPGAIVLVKQLRANNIASVLVLGSNPAAFEKVAFIVRVGYRPQNNNE